jgi:hypothetical protein
MVTAIVIAVLTMMVASGPLARFVDEHPTIKVLALAFLLLVGMALVGEGLDFHIPKGYIYFAMAFSVGVEIINLRVRARAAAARRRPPPAGDSSGVWGEQHESASHRRVCPGGLHRRRHRRRRSGRAHRHADRRPQRSRRLLRRRRAPAARRGGEGDRAPRRLGQGRSRAAARGVDPRVCARHRATAHFAGRRGAALGVEEPVAQPQQHDRPARSTRIVPGSSPSSSCKASAPRAARSS